MHYSGVVTALGYHEHGHTLQTAAKVKAATKRKAEAQQKRQKAIKEARALLTRWTESLIEPTMPMRQWPEAQAEAALDQLRACDSVSAANMPSCIMFTYPQVLLLLQPGAIALLSALVQRVRVLFLISTRCPFRPRHTQNYFDVSAALVLQWCATALH
jgi:hypothetical protein